jgi:carbonic anhydrase
MGSLFPPPRRVAPAEPRARKWAKKGRVNRVPASEALRRLRQGNARFVANVLSIDSLARRLRRSEFKEDHAPFAIVVGCSDSRAPAELLFDQGMGDLFVIRVAGNVISPSQIGSVEFAAESLGTRLVVVMGHTHCAAIDVTLRAVERGERHDSDHVMSIVERVRPAVEAVRDAAGRRSREAILRSAVRANVRVAVDHLRHGSSLLQKISMEDGLAVVGAEYDLEKGKVDFFEVPDTLGGPSGKKRRAGARRKRAAGGSRAP